MMISSSISVLASVSSIIVFSFLLVLPSISGLNQQGISLLSWLSTFNSSSSATFFDSWDFTHQNPCSWDYVRCSGDGFVTEIQISSINLQTTFPLQVLAFNSLTKLVFSNANLTGEIPQTIANLSSLIVLDLSFNALTGKIPAKIGELSKLEFLSLNSNSLSGEIPQEIGNCSTLKRVELYDNLMFGKIPAEFGRLKALEILRAGGNQGIHGGIPDEISNCEGLTFLGLADTGISGRIPRSFGGLKNLKTLSVYTANLIGEIPPELGNCSSLENLFLYQNQLSGEIPEELGNMKSIKRVLLWQNNLSGEIPESLGNGTGLVVIDFSLNALTGEVPLSLAKLITLEELLLSENEISGQIPSFFGNFSFLKQLELDNNRFSGGIPSSIGRLKQISLFFAWQNQLTGTLPAELSGCEKLEALDLSHNSLSGSIPDSLFNLKNLSQLLLISNRFSGEIPQNLGNCTGLTRLRLGSNEFAGRIPSEIGLLRGLSFLELSENRFQSVIPPEIGNCTQLEMVDLHGNELHGNMPSSFSFLVELNVLDLSMNRLTGAIPENLGKLSSLNKLILKANFITGSIPSSLGLCKALQLLDISSNRISGSIPSEIGHIQELDILLNLSSNSLTGKIPQSFSNLSKLANLDISHNMLIGNLGMLGNLDDLVSLDVSFNNFSGVFPDTKFFQNLPASAFAGNKNLCIKGNGCYSDTNDPRKSTRNLIVFAFLSVVAAASFVLIMLSLFMKVRGTPFSTNSLEDSLDWEFTPFQKFSFSVNDIITRLSDSNIVGKGCSSIVYHVETPAKQVIAVKKLWPLRNGEVPEGDFFSNEVQILGSIRHRNIVRLLGCCNNGKTRLLLFDYISNGCLAGLLHEKRLFLDWDARYKIILGAAHGLAYLHHDCIPPILHRDIKANNILVGSQFEAVIADFGLAKLVDSSGCSRPSNVVAGSYGYIAPEYGYNLRITEKSDVYSYGVVILEVLTGKTPTDNRIPEGDHIVTWVNKELRDRKKESAAIFDQQLVQRSGTQIQQMFQVLGVALLCVNASPEERPTMKDVTAMLKEIKHEAEEYEKPNLLERGAITNPKAAVHCSSFSRSSEPLIRAVPSAVP